jgi:hypothetical protein
MSKSIYMMHAFMSLKVTVHPALIVAILHLAMVFVDKGEVFIFI